MYVYLFSVIVVSEITDKLIHSLRQRTIDTNVRKRRCAIFQYLLGCCFDDKSGDNLVVSFGTIEIYVGSTR